MTDKQKHIASSVVCLIVAAALLAVAIPKKQTKQYYQHNGNVFGTYYNIRYEASDDLEQDILNRLSEFDASLSTFNPSSTISAINQGRDTVLDDWFLKMYNTAEEVSRLSGGAFDITVAPLVNVWGFGFKNKENVTPEQVDSIRQYVGWQTISVEDKHLQKKHPETMLDASAIAKGYGCDVIADLLREKGCENYLVDIGGEVVLHGVNQEGKAWRVGITKPIDDVTGQTNEIQEVIESEDLCMATSGNYRQFYYEGGMRRSHTIDPRTGYPVAHNLLSATVVASSCMEADALATACMVLGTDSALALIKRIPDAECYLIYDAFEEGTTAPKDTTIRYAIAKTDGFPIGKD